ncbi:hypothetical protein CKO23_25335 [Thiocystis violacea]|nr:hypothetical protein [Thiocystis violacea]MBK1725416.1 hypothetical protein [Thiocystis violacea]
MEALSGNSSDKTGFRESIKAHLGQLQRDVGLEVVIADSALYTRETLQEMNGYHWISRVPETLTLAREHDPCGGSRLRGYPEQKMLKSLKF